MEDKLELLKRRSSVRAFSDVALSKEEITKLKAEITMINTHQQGFRFQLITNDPDPMKGFSASYGVFRNPRNYMAAVVDPSTPHAYERAGYFAEKFVIKAVSLGLGTCFVGGTFNEKQVKAQMRAGEKILFIILVGKSGEKEKLAARLMAKMVHLKKMDADSFFLPRESVDDAKRKFPILQAGLEAVSCAPSALNKRPVRIFVDRVVDKETLCAKVAENDPKLLIDLGIAKYNFNFATSTECEWGNGSSLMTELI
ncbi:MAG: nitroreductase family protein [Muribaculaceae bacterium]|nr:nitroreductase family protein [Muribaculaceae bacterium]